MIYLTDKSGCLAAGRCIGFVLLRLPRRRVQAKMESWQALRNRYECVKNCTLPCWARSTRGYSGRLVNNLGPTDHVSASVHKDQLVRMIRFASSLPPDHRVLSACTLTKGEETTLGVVPVDAARSSHVRNRLPCPPEGSQGVALMAPASSSYRVQQHQTQSLTIKERYVYVQGPKECCQRGGHRGR